MRKILAIISIIILIIVTAFLWITKLSPKARKARLNVENSFKLQVGMPTNQLIEIMGIPDNIRYRSDTGFNDSIYFYQPPFASSQGIDIVVKEDTIREIVHFE